MKLVRDILGEKGTDVWRIKSDDTVFDALQLMADKDVGALLVCDGEHVIGIFSERDYARRIVLLGKRSQEVRVSDIMTRDVLFVRPDQTCEECMALMTKKRVRHLPVVEGERLAGVISIGDVVNACMAQRDHEIEHLVNYINGNVR